MLELARRTLELPQHQSVEAVEVRNVAPVPLLRVQRFFGSKWFWIALVYTLCPLDLMPDVPIVGWIDDATVWFLARQMHREETRMGSN